MEKKTYYVSLDMGPQTGMIHDQPDDTDPVFDFEIQATEEEIKRLEQLFSYIAEKDTTIFFQAHIPYLDKEKMEKNSYDEALAEVYHYIYELGTPETKRRMKESGMIIQ